MAAVTTNSQTQPIVTGSILEKFYNLEISTGQTLATEFGQIHSVTFNDVAITKAAVSGGTITFTTTGAVSGALVRVAGTY